MRSFFVSLAVLLLSSAGYAFDISEQVQSVRGHTTTITVEAGTPADCEAKLKSVISVLNKANKVIVIKRDGCSVDSSAFIIVL